ncbi:MAG: tetratricopeptide repeat protein, partial [Myxococcota bacterium]
MNVAKYLFAASWLLAFAAHADGGVVITDSSKPAYVSSKAVYHYIMSRLKEQDNNLPGSLEEMRLAVAHDSASPYLHLALSNSLLRTYSVQSAISQAEEAVRLAPEKAEGHIQLGNIFMHTGELDRAETSFKEAIKAEPKNMDGYTELSRLFILTKKIAEAEAVFQMMMANFPGDPAGYFNAGAVFYERRVLDKAETYLRKALEKDPAHEMAGIYLSKTLEMQRRYPEAKKVLESLLHFVSDDPEILLALGRLSIISGDMQGARRYFDHLKRSSGSEAETAVTIAMAWVQEGAVEEAVREINEVAATYPDREPVKYYRGIILEEIKDYRAAADIFATFKRTSRFYYDALVHLELCNVKLGKFETAIRDLVPYVTSTGKPDPLAVHVLTEAWIQSGKIPEGVAFFNRLQKSHPSWVETAEALSRLLERQGDSAGAAAVYDDLLKRDDLDREDREKALLLKAMSLEKIGDDAGSLEYAYQALKIGPDSPEAL